MPKSKKRKPKATAAKRTKNIDQWDFKVSVDPNLPAEIYSKIVPLDPALVLEDGRLTHSPSETYLGLVRNGGDPELIEMMARWPWRIAWPHKEAGPWICMAQIAYETGRDLVDVAKSQAWLESQKLLVWSGEHNVYVMNHETSAMQGASPEERERIVDEMFDQINAEGPAEQARRRWTQVTVVPVDG